MDHTILLVDDEPNVLDGLSRALRKEPYDILTAGSAMEAAVLLKEFPVDLIVSDEEMPGLSGTEFLARVAQEYPETVRIVLTGHPTLAAAMRAINEGGVYQFFTKPCNEIDLAMTIRRALEQKDLLARSRELLELTKRQSSLLDEVRLMKRSSDHPQEKPAEAPTPEGDRGDLSDTRALLDQMANEIGRVKSLLSSMDDSCKV